MPKGWGGGGCYSGSGILATWNLGRDLGIDGAKDLQTLLFQLLNRPSFSSKTASPAEQGNDG